jgi:hypothetical protein
LVLDGSTKTPLALSRKFLAASLLAWAGRAVWLQLASKQLDSVVLIHGYTSAPRSEPEKQIQLKFHDIRNPQAQDAKFQRAIL